VRSMRVSVVAISVIVLALSSACMLRLAFAQTQPVINSQWTNTPPVIDGKFVAGEWSNLQISMTSPDYPIEAYAYFMNDNSNLYVLVDAVGDKQFSSGDECLLWFGFKDVYPWHIVDVAVYGDGHLSPGTGFDGAVGFDSSPNSPDQHRIYEFRIPLSLINIQPGQPIVFCSPLVGKGSSIVYDANSGSDNVYPNTLVCNPATCNADTWAMLTTQVSVPVGGFVEPVNRLSMIAPYMVLFGAIAALAVVVARKRDF
jgi:hypothetical protein